jgi:hydrogenase maturation factor
MKKPSPLPLGKLPPELLARLLANAPITDERVLLGPGIGLDCAVIDAGPNLLVFKSEPITFVTDKLGWYAVQISVNDVATTGALPRWLLATLLLPENQTTEELVVKIGEELFAACRELGISLVGGHTEITHGIDHPILVAALVGEVERERLVTPRGAAPGDAVLLTKGIPIEGTAILAAEFPQRLSGILSADELRQAADYLYAPGISVFKDARVALAAGGVTAMHDPTEGGLAAALWEMAEASGHTFAVDPRLAPLPDLARRVCQAFGLDPLATIASGALLLTVKAESAEKVMHALHGEGIACRQIGVVKAGQPQVELAQGDLLPRPTRDEITKVFEA